MKCLGHAGHKITSISTYLNSMLSLKIDLPAVRRARQRRGETEVSAGRLIAAFMALRDFEVLPGVL
jgi:hypothetical protein